MGNQQGSQGARRCSTKLVSELTSSWSTQVAHAMSVRLTSRCTTLWSWQNLTAVSSALTCLATVRSENWPTSSRRSNSSPPDSTVSAIGTLTPCCACALRYLCTFQAPGISVEKSLCLWGKQVSASTLWHGEWRGQMCVSYQTRLAGSLRWDGP